MTTKTNMEHDDKGFNRLTTLFDQSNTGLWEMRPNGDVRFFNEKFYHNFDISIENSSIDDWIKIIHPDDKVHFINGVSLHEHTQVESYKTEYRVLNIKNEVIWIEAQGIASFDEQGNLTSMVGSHTNVTLDKGYNIKLYDLAYVDPISRLFNRQKLIETLEYDKITNRDGTLILLDFYQMKQLISLYGHAYYNDITSQITKLIKKE